MEEFTSKELEVTIWNVGSAVLKDNFQISETVIPLSGFSNVIPDKRGVQIIENWYNMKLILNH